MGRSKKVVTPVVDAIAIDDLAAAAAEAETVVTELVPEGPATDGPLPTIEEIESVVGAIEVQEGEAPAPTALTFLEIYEGFEHEAVLAFANEIVGELDVRAAQEALDHPDNDSIQKNLGIARKHCTTLRTARTLLACGLTDASFINRVWHDGSYFNVYALSTKLASIRDALVEGIPLSNAINFAVITSMFRLERAGIGFDFDLAKCAASRDYPVMQAGVRSHLVRHTVGKSTASTQAGSTMHMLAAMGIVAINGRGKNPSYTILDNPQTKRLREVVLGEASE